MHLPCICALRWRKSVHARRLARKEAVGFVLIYQRFAAALVAVRPFEARGPRRRGGRLVRRAGNRRHAYVRRTNRNALRMSPKGVWGRNPIGSFVGLLDGLASNVGDIAATDAEVAQFAVRHAAEFVDGLTVLAPVVERACEVHFEPLSWVCSRSPLSGSGFDLMTRNIRAIGRNYRDNAVWHPCTERMSSNNFDEILVKIRAF